MVDHPPVPGDVEQDGGEEQDEELGDAGERHDYAGGQRRLRQRMPELRQDGARRPADGEGEAKADAGDEEDSEGR